MPRHGCPSLSGDLLSVTPSSLKVVEQTYFWGGSMSMVIAQPEILAAAAEGLQALNSAVWAENAAAEAATTGVIPAAADVVSILAAAQFASHARRYQEISAQAAALREQLATTLGISAGSYAATEAANAAAVG
jgi:hypothetical protein